MKKIVFIALCLLVSAANAQDSTKSPLTFSGYIEPYYTYDMGNPLNHTRPGFVYSHNRHNEVNLNIGFVKAAYATNNVRGNLALMTGTYSNANLAAEDGVIKNIYEANVGMKLSKTKNLWVDAGIFASHIGFESAIGKDCWTLTRSIMADNTPYYESGAKISYTSKNEKWFFSGLFLNGWQRIKRVDANNTPAFGTQVTFKPNSKITLNSSTFVGNDKPDSVKQMRYFHNFYGIFQITKKISATLGFDIGAEQKSKNSAQYNTWYNPELVVKCQISEKSSIALRGEYYNDKNGVIIATGTPNGFETIGYSANFDYALASNILWRIEARALSSKDEIFVMDNKPSTQNYFFTTAFALSF